MTWPRNIKALKRRLSKDLPNGNWSIKFTIVKNVIYSFLAPGVFPIAWKMKSYQGKEGMTTFVNSLGLPKPQIVIQPSRNTTKKQTAWPTNTTTPSEKELLGFVFAISKILLKLYGNFFNINRITNCISVLKEGQLHIGVWSLYRFISCYFKESAKPITAKEYIYVYYHCTR